MSKPKEKPVGAKAGWQLRESRTRFQNNVFRLREDRIDLGDREHLEYAYMERAEAVVIVPVTREGEIVLLKQYRYPVDDWCLEVPAGGTHDTGGDGLEEVVRKELREEIGATVESLTPIGFFYSASSLTDEKCRVYLAEGVVLAKKPEQETSESIELQLTPVRQVVELARSGKMKTAQCALAVLLCEPLLAERGYLK